MTSSTWRRRRAPARAGSGSQMSSHTRMPALMPFNSTTVGSRAGREIALLVEYAIVGQAGLAVIREHHAVAHHDRGIVDLRALVFRVAGDQRDAAHLGLQPLDRARDLGAHAGMEQQVLGRITRDRQFGQHHDVGAARGRALRWRPRRCARCCRRRRRPPDSAAPSRNAAAADCVKLVPYPSCMHDLPSLPNRSH